MKINKKLLIVIIISTVFFNQNQTIAKPTESNQTTNSQTVKYNNEQDNEQDPTCGDIFDLDPGIETLYLITIALIWILYPPKIP